MTSCFMYVFQAISKFNILSVTDKFSFLQILFFNLLPLLGVFLLGWSFISLGFYFLIYYAILVLINSIKIVFNFKSYSKTYLAVTFIYLIVLLFAIAFFFEVLTVLIRIQDTILYGNNWIPGKIGDTIYSTKDLMQKSLLIIEVIKNSFGGWLYLLPALILMVFNSLTHTVHSGIKFVTNIGANAVFTEFFTNTQGLIEFFVVLSIGWGSSFAIWVLLYATKLVNVIGYNNAGIITYSIGFIGVIAYLRISTELEKLFESYDTRNLRPYSEYK